MADYNSSLTGEQIEQTLLGAVLSNKAQRLTEEQKAQARKNIGAGTSDTGLKILGYYATADQMAAAVLSPKAGDAYAVGSAVPYDIYIWDAAHRTWVNNGNIRGADGKDADLSDAEPMKHKFTDVRVEASSYVADDTYPDFPFRVEIPLDGINETMTPCVAFDVAEAIGGLFAPVAECYNGGVYIYAESALNYEIIIPTIICWEGVYAVDDPAAEKLILSYDDLRALVQNEVNAAGEAATQAQTYAEQAKAYADEAKNGYIADGSVTAEKIVAGAVTREKLAQDALYSPITKPTTTTYNVVASDLGKTIVDAYSTRNNNLTWNLSKSLLDSSPIGTEIAFARTYTSQSITLSITGARIINADSGQVGGASRTVSFSLPEKGSMCALKKLENDSTYGSFWILTGNVEVVS